ncbi:MAG TPA: glucosyl-3-phosphoglycerate synthase [Solirubrobacteraceae bacterium]|nr:glucosyl-3-phosphoglycerate synthase [Solirubrobacteraceae bacterium]
MRARSWHRSHTFHHSEFPPERLASERRHTVSVCLPARNEQRTIGAIVSSLTPLRDQGAIDQIVVVDASSDDTGRIARELGAEVHKQQNLRPEMGPVQGKGDAMWRSLAVLTGEVICFLDADSEHFGAHFACGLLGPLLFDSRISFVKGLYRRPFRVGETTLPDGGGRVTELTARPLLNLFYPDLAGVAQPLAGEVAARRELLESLPVVTGYGVDIALLVDAYTAVGLEGLAQVDLDVRQNAHQPLRDLGPMAFAVLRALASRLERDGRLSGPLPMTFLAPGDEELPTLGGDQVERPPVATLRAAA